MNRLNSMQIAKSGSSLIFAPYFNLSHPHDADTPQIEFRNAQDKRVFENHAVETGSSALHHRDRTPTWSGWSSTGRRLRVARASARASSR